MKEIIKLATDLAMGRVDTEFTNGNDANQKLREAINELLGAEDGKPVSKRQMMRKRDDIFEIIAQTVEVKIDEGLTNQFQELVEYSNLARGDKNEFHIKDNQLFKVAVIADGVGRIRKQRVRDGEKFSVRTECHAISIYEELTRFLANRIDWAEMATRITESYLEYVQEVCHTAIVAGLEKNAGSGVYRQSGTYEEEKLLSIVDHMEAKNRKKCMIVGTRKALRKVAPSAVSDNMRDARNRLGYYGMVAGVPLVEVPQSHEIGTDTFILADDLYIMPMDGEKPLKLVNEGEAYMDDRKAENNADLSMEIFFSMNFGVAFVPAYQYGIYKLS